MLSHEIREDKALTLEDSTLFNVDGLGEHRRIEHEGVEFSVLATWIDGSWQLGQKGGVEISAGVLAI